MNKKSVQSLAVIFSILFFVGCTSKVTDVEVKENIVPEPMLFVETETDFYALDVSLESIGNEEIDSIITSEVQNRINEFKGFFVEGFESAAQPLLSVSGYVTVYSDQIKIYFIDTYEYSGGAHGSVFVETFVYDMNTLSLLNFGDIFLSEKKEALESLVRGKVISQIGDGYDQQWVEEGTIINDINYQSWEITAEGIKIIFNPYQVGPYVLGVINVILPWEEIELFMTPDFLESYRVSEE